MQQTKSQNNQEFVNIPESFFLEHISKINDSDLYKLLLYIFWRFSKTDSLINFITTPAILSDEIFCDNFGEKRDEIKERISLLIKSAIELEVLIKCKHPKHSETSLYFYNSPKNNILAESIAKGEIPFEEIRNINISISKPNIFKLYEENIGALTPIIAETIEDAENNYPLEWIEEAINIAVTNNVRRWKYIQAILERWQEEGRNARRDKKDSEEDRKKYLGGKFNDLIEH